MRTFEAFYSVVRQSGESEATWRTVGSLLNALSHFNLVNSGVVERFPVFSSIANWATDAMVLREGLSISLFRPKFTDKLSLLEICIDSPILVLLELVRLEFVIVESLVPRIICNLAMVCLFEIWNNIIHFIGTDAYDR